jgi:hypothetical protein
LCERAGAYTPFNAGAVIKVRSDASHRGCQPGEAHHFRDRGRPADPRRAVKARSRAARAHLRRRPRISETVALTWSDVLLRDNRVQLSITGKGGKVRQVLLPEVVSRSVLSLRGEAGVCRSRWDSSYSQQSRSAAAGGIGHFRAVSCAQFFAFCRSSPLPWPPDEQRGAHLRPAARTRSIAPRRPEVTLFVGKPWQQRRGGPLSRVLQWGHRSRADNL